MNKEVSVGVNVASLFPWSWVPFFGPKFSVKILEMAGLDFFQLLPFRTYNRFSLKDFGSRVFYYEGSWNNGYLWQVPFREITKLEKYPKIWDVAFFGSENKSKKVLSLIEGFFPAAKKIEHHFGGDLVEINSDMTLSAVLNALPSDKLIVFDLWHCFEYGANSRRRLINPEYWDLAISELLETHKIPLMHYKEGSDIFGPNWRRIYQEMLPFLGCREVVLETRPRPASLNSLVSYLREEGNFIRSVLN